MDIRDKQKIQNSVITFSVLFHGALDEVPSDPIEDIAMVVPSDTDTEEHGWLGTVPGFTEWVGDRKLGTLRAEGMQLKNRDWANGIRVGRNTILDDKLGLVRPRIQMLAIKARQHRPQHMVEVLANGFDGANPKIGTGLSYDGAFLISDSHREGDGKPQSNLGTRPLDHASYATARVAMQTLVDEQGDPLYVQPSHLLVGPENEQVGREILESDLRIVGGVATRNVQRGTAELLVSPRLVGPWAKYWFVLDLTKPVKPLILQMRQEIEFHALEDMQSDAAFMRKEHKYGADARYAVGSGLWQMVYGSKGAA